MKNSYLPLYMEVKKLKKRNSETLSWTQNLWQQITVDTLA